jgi:SAM-dependent methyltransferase
VIETFVERQVHRLNWGCDQTVQPGWINSDIKQGSHIDITCDIRLGLPLESNSIDYAVSVHALQEIAYDDVVPVLRELHRVLKPDGVLRLVLPDIDKAIEAYSHGADAFYIAPAGVGPGPSCAGIPDVDMRSLGGKFILQLIWYGYTRTLFNHDFVEELLYRAGFGRVEHVAFGFTSSLFREITELDSRENESLLVEAYY